MDSLKLSFFDLLSFLLPGGFFVSSVILVLEHAFNIDFGIADMSGISILLPYFFLSYFIGHLLSYLGKKLEKLYLGKSPWKKALVQNMSLAKDLDKLNNKLFDKSFFANKHIDDKRSEQFFVNAYNRLLVDGHKETFPVLKAQYGFFRTAVALWSLLFIVLAGAFFLALCYSGFNANWFVLAVLSLAAIIVSINRTIERKQYTYIKVYHIFLSIHLKPDHNES